MALRVKPHSRPAVRQQHGRSVRRGGGLAAAQALAQGQGQGGQSAQPPQTDPSMFDYSADPILQRIRALAQQHIAAAEAAATAARSQQLIRYGFAPELAGLYDSGTRGAAAANPNSTLAVLQRSHEARSRNITNADNARNLFYSSTYGQHLGQEGQQYLGEQQSAADRLQQALGGISEGLAGARSTEQDRIAQAEEDAYQRALEFGMKYGMPGGGGGSVAGAGRGVRPFHSPIGRALAARSVRRLSHPRVGGR